jgi:serine/threonine protein kinase
MADFASDGFYIGTNFFESRILYGFAITSFFMPTVLFVIFNFNCVWIQSKKTWKMIITKTRKKIVCERPEEGLEEFADVILLFLSHCLWFVSCIVLIVGFFGLYVAFLTVLINMKMSLYRPALRWFFQLSGENHDSDKLKERMNYVLSSSIFTEVFAESIPELIICLTNEFSSKTSEVWTATFWAGLSTTFWLALSTSLYSIISASYPLVRHIYYAPSIIAGLSEPRFKHKKLVVQPLFGKNTKVVETKEMVKTTEMVKTRCVKLKVKWAAWKNRRNEARAKKASIMELAGRLINEPPIDYVFEDGQIQWKAMLEKHRWKQVEGIGQKGGSGAIVFKAYDVRTEKIVALKVFDMDDDRTSRSRKQVEREAAILESLRGHDHICNHIEHAYLDPNFEQKRLFYIVMEYIDGDVLTIPPDGFDKVSQTLKIAKHILLALKEMHEKKFVHRDIKPDNIIFCKETKNFKVIDTGLALKLKGNDLQNSVQMTMQTSGGGGGDGTPQYMAPEQFDRYGVISEAADIWGLAVTMYQCLTGKLPFSEKRTPRREIQKAIENLEEDEMLLQHARTEMEGKKIPPETVALVMKAMRFKPNDRYTADGMLQDLPKSYDLFLSHTQIEASGEVGTLSKSLELIGISSWRDMTQENIDTSAMIKGVQDSDVFMLLLTTRTLSRWYCLLEFACALKERKPIVVVVEEETRFHAWNFQRWTEDKSKTGDIDDELQITYKDLEKSHGFSEKLGGGPDDAVRIRDFITEEHTNMIPHRRRGFEFDMMMYEILRRGNIDIPKELKAKCHPSLSPDIVKPSAFFLVHSNTGDTIAEEMKESLETLGQHVMDRMDDKSIVLVVLTGGVLEDEACLVAIEKAFQKGNAIQYVMSFEAGWKFEEGKNDREKKCRNRLVNYEVMIYRGKGGNREYEHNSMMHEMMKRLKLNKDTAKMVKTRDVEVTI